MFVVQGCVYWQIDGRSPFWRRKESENENGENESKLHAHVNQKNVER
jgi:hypothetical protein